MSNDAQTPVGSKTSLRGHEPDMSDHEQRRAAIDLAFDYRGDVTIHTHDGRTIEGYIFDRRAEVDEPHIRMMPKNGTSRLVVRYAEIRRLQFTGRDTAAGKSWETWVTQYIEKKRRGEPANIDVK